MSWTKSGGLVPRVTQQVAGAHTPLMMAIYACSEGRPRQVVRPGAIGGSQDQLAAGHRWGPAKGPQAPHLLVLGVSRQMASEALGHSKAFAAALAIINDVLGTFGTL